MIDFGRKLIMGRILDPWIPVEASQAQDKVQVKVWGRTYEQNKTCLPSSITTQGQELLFAPIRLTGEANGEPIIWEDEGCYLLNPTEESACINGFAQSQCLIADSSLQIDLDGGARWDVKVMPRGLTVPQVFGLEPCPIKGWELNKLQLEIPLRKEVMKLYCSWRGVWGKDECIVSLKDHVRLETNGSIPEGGLASKFQATLWLGDENVGIQFCVESDELWQPADPNHTLEILDKGDHWVLCYHLLDSLPKSWKNPGSNSPVLSYSFGVIPTPVKPFNDAYLDLKVVHIDCFTKLKGDYWPFLTGPISEDSDELVIDRLCRAGVNMLILHEKWNKMQNNWNVPVTTAEEITKLVRLCHSRGIKVIPYFGYEITSAMPNFTEARDEAQIIYREAEAYHTGWYRVPYQRAARFCNASSWADKFVQGMMECVDRFHFDGVYLDTTSAPGACLNTKHGCGYTDEHGHVHATYTVFATRELFKKIYKEVHARGGIVNPHPAGATVPYITSFSDMLWDGEHLQTRIRDEGLTAFSLEYMRAEYLGTNYGIPVQFIVYELENVWNFDMALSLCMIHGIYPRPNSVWHPLDVMEKVWNITGTFGISKAKFQGYWENEAAVQLSDSNCKASYYVKDQVDGTKRVLLIAANPTPDASECCKITINPQAFGLNDVVSAFNAMEKKFTAVENDGVQLPLKPYDYAMYEIVLA